jgi:hypothetical protein
MRPIRCFLKHHHLHRSIHTIAPSYRHHWSQLRWIRIHSRSQNPSQIHWIPSHCRHFHRMACCQTLNRWDQCRLVQIRYHFVLMIRNRNLMACYHFAIRTQSPTGNLTANPNRIGCQIHSVSRFAIRSVNHCLTIHCRLIRYRLVR